MTENQKNNMIRWGEFGFYVVALVVSVTLAFGSIKARVDILESKVNRLERMEEKINSIAGDVREIRAKVDIWRKP